MSNKTNATNDEQTSDLSTKMSKLRGLQKATPVSDKTWLTPTDIKRVYKVSPKKLQNFVEQNPQAIRTLSSGVRVEYHCDDVKAAFGRAVPTKK